MTTKFKIGDRIRAKKGVGQHMITARKFGWEGVITNISRTWEFNCLPTLEIETNTVRHENKSLIGKKIIISNLEMYELVERNRVELHVTAKDGITTAVKKVDGKVVARAEAKCSPKDEYDADKGIRIALAKLELQEAMK